MNSNRRGRGRGRGNARGRGRAARGQGRGGRGSGNSTPRMPRAPSTSRAPRTASASGGSGRASTIQNTYVRQMSKFFMYFTTLSNHCNSRQKYLGCTHGNHFNRCGHCHCFALIS